MLSPYNFSFTIRGYKPPYGNSVSFSWPLDIVPYYNFDFTQSGYEPPAAGQVDFSFGKRPPEGVIIASIVGQGNLNAAARAISSAAGALFGQSSLVASLIKGAVFTASLPGEATVKGVYGSIQPTQGLLSGQAAVYAQVTTVSQITASLTGLSQVAAELQAQTSITGLLEGIGALDGYAGSHKFYNFDFTIPGYKPPSATQVDFAFGSGAPEIVRLTGYLTGQSSVNADLDLHISAEGQISSQGTLLASGLPLLVLNAALAGEATVDGSSINASRFSFSANGVGNLQAGGQAYGQITGSLAGISSLTATSATQQIVPVTAALAGTASLNASLAYYQALQGQLSGQAAVAAVLTGDLSLIAQLSGISDVNAFSPRPKSLTGQSIVMFIT